MEGYRGDVYAWKDIGATFRHGRIQGLRVRVAGYRVDVYAWKDTVATCTRGRTQTGGATLAWGRGGANSDEGIDTLWYSRYSISSTG